MIVSNADSSDVRMTIQPNGKVGIGSETPTEILDVSGTADMKMVVQTEDSGAGANAGVRIATGDGYKWLLQVGDSTTSGGLRIYQETSGSAGERLRITSGGNMGLGVTPETWSSNVKGFQIGRQACVSGQTGANIVEISVNTDMLSPLITKAREINDEPKAPPGRIDCKDCEKLDSLLSIF